MTVVVDLGCAPCEGVDSIAILVDRFNPEVLFGFDPLMQDEVQRVKQAAVLLSSQAAWITNGWVKFFEDGVASCLIHDGEMVLPEPYRLFTGSCTINPVRCFDLAAWLAVLPGKVVAKCDIEGAELTLLPHLIDTGAAWCIDLLLMEWHTASVGDEARRDAILSALPCPVEDWAH